MDKIFLRGMKAETLIGVYSWERQNRQTLILDLDIGIAPLSGSDDDLNGSVHYGEVCLWLRQEWQQCRFQLLEALAQHTCERLFAQFPRILAIKLRITKPGILNGVQETGIEIERTRNEIAQR